MTDEDGAGVHITDGRSSIRLIPAGDLGPVGRPTLIEIEAGPLKGAIERDLLDYSRFQSELVSLYETLTGRAILGSYEKFELSLLGDGRGQIKVRVDITLEYIPLIHLEYEFQIDQTYLPQIIASIQDEFL